MFSCKVKDLLNYLNNLIILRKIVNADFFKKKIYFFYFLFNN